MKKSSKSTIKTQKSPEIQIIIATHKPYAMPMDSMYLPLQVGRKCAKIKISDYTGDDRKDNISRKNSTFCELTGLYWAWKNLDAKYIGLVHYRRHFRNVNHGTGNDVEALVGATFLSQPKSAKIIKNLQHTATEPEIQQVLKTTDIILPKKRHYYIENLYNHYCKTLKPEPLEKTRAIIAKKCPEYLPEFDKLKKRRSAHMFNMFIMQRDVLDKYCDWLFSILFELEKQVDTTNWDAFQKRYIGRISERLLDVWINTNKLEYQELPIINIEPINWLKKGSGFLKAKLFGRKYAKSW